MDEFGKGHDKPLHEAVAKQSDYVTSMHEHPSTENEDHPLEKSNKTKCPNTHCGCKMVFDNLVYTQVFHSTTGDHQTAIVIMSLQCPLKSGCPSTRFSTETPQSGLLEMENGSCLPSDIWPTCVTTTFPISIAVRYERKLRQ